MRKVKGSIPFTSTKDMFKKIKKIIAFCAAIFGFVFALCLILNIWGLVNFQNQDTTSRTVFTLGVLTLSFITLLGIIKMIEEKR